MSTWRAVCSGEVATRVRAALVDIAAALADVPVRTPTLGSGYGYLHKAKSAPMSVRNMAYN